MIDELGTNVQREKINSERQVGRNVLETQIIQISDQLKTTWFQMDDDSEGYTKSHVLFYSHHKHLVLLNKKILSLQSMHKVTKIIENA